MLSLGLEFVKKWPHIDVSLRENVLLSFECMLLLMFVLQIKVF